MNIIENLNSNNFVTDIDGNEYRVVQIGQYLWINRNLLVTKFNNGQKINYAKNFGEWDEFIMNDIPAYCYYDFNESFKDQFGALYNKNVLEATLKSSNLNIAIEGWHLPSEYVMNDLSKGIGVEKCAPYIKSNEYWKNAPHNNISGLNLVPSGLFEYDKFSGMGDSCTLGVISHSNSFKLCDSHDFIHRNSTYYDSGLSLRCVKSATIPNTIPIVQPELPLIKQIELELINGLNLLGETKRKLLVDFIAALLIVTPSDIRETHVDLYNRRANRNPIKEMNIDIKARMDYIYENEYNNNLIIKRLVTFNLMLSEEEALFVYAYLDWMIFSRIFLDTFELSNSNAFLYILTSVDKVKKHYLSNKSNFIDERIHLDFIRKVVNKMLLI